jgi:PST family polysaccharide transporter
MSDTRKDSFADAPGFGHLDSGAVDNLGDHAKRGGAIILISMLIQRGLGLICLAIMARQLEPRDFGLAGMAAILSSLLTIFADLGLPDAMVQRASITRRELSAAFWLNVFASIVIGGVMASLAPAMARFYGEPQLRDVTYVFAAYFPLVGLGAQHYALLVRRMQYKRLAIAETMGFAIGGASGVIMAMNHFGPYALIGQYMVNQVVVLIMNAWSARWMPGLPGNFGLLRGVVHVGGNLTASKFVDYVIKNLDNFLLGRFCGAAQLGLYTRAYTLMQYPILLISSPMGRVTLPVLARLQHDLPRLRAAYVRVLQVIAFISFPLMACLMVTADQVIRVIYGGKWTAVVPVFRILCVAGIYQGIYSASSQLFIATGRTNRMLRCSTALCVALGGAFYVGVHWGPLGTAAAYAITLTLLILPYLAYAYATIGLRLATVLSALKTPFLASIAMATLVYALRPPVGPYWHPLLRLAISGVIGMAAYVGLMVLFARPFLHDVVISTITGMVPATKRFLPHWGEPVVEKPASAAPVVVAAMPVEVAT